MNTNYNEAIKLEIIRVTKEKNTAASKRDALNDGSIECHRLNFTVHSTLRTLEFLREQLED